MVITYCAAIDQGREHPEAVPERGADGGHADHEVDAGSDAVDVLREDVDLCRRDALLLALDPDIRRGVAQTELHS